MLAVSWGLQGVKQPAFAVSLGTGGPVGGSVPLGEEQAVLAVLHRLLEQPVLAVSPRSGGQLYLWGKNSQHWLFLTGHWGEEDTEKTSGKCACTVSTIFSRVIVWV